METKSYPDKKSWILIPKTQGLPLWVSWRQKDQGKEVPRREKYFLLNAFWSPDGNFRTSAKSISLWVADIYFEPQFADKSADIGGVTHPNEHVHNINQQVSQHWVKVKLDKRFQYGQDKAPPDTTSRWVVYHPTSWKPKQANFEQGGFTHIASNLITNNVKTAISAGIKLAEPSGIVALGVTKLMPWDKVKDYAQDSMRSYGDPLRTFGEDLTQEQEAQILRDQEDYLAALEEVKLQVDSDEKLAGISLEERLVVSHVVVALNLGLQGVAEEGPHHGSRPSPNIPVPFNV